MREKRVPAPGWTPPASALLSIVLATVSTAEPDATKTEGYVASIDEWHAGRIERLVQPEGWLSLVGLFWLTPGENRFGNDPQLSISLPADKAPPFAGVLTLEEGAVVVTTAVGVEIFSDGERVTKRRLLTDRDGNPTVLELGSLRFYVIERGGRLALRVKDREHPDLASFTGVDRFDVDAAWRVHARFEPYDPAKSIEVPDVTGFVNQAECPGALVFTVQGVEHRIDVLSAEDGFFVVFGDESNGRSTYGGGRFLSVDPPDEEGTIFVDFNKATNPPCAFTPYATCPLPSEGNHLSVAVEAGEQSYGHH